MLCVKTVYGRAITSCLRNRKLSNFIKKLNIFKYTKSELGFGRFHLVWGMKKETGNSDFLNTGNLSKYGI